MALYSAKEAKWYRRNVERREHRFIIFRTRHYSRLLLRFFFVSFPLPLRNHPTPFSSLVIHQFFFLSFSRLTIHRNESRLISLLLNSYTKPRPSSRATTLLFLFLWTLRWLTRTRRFLVSPPSSRFNYTLRAVRTRRRELDCSTVRKWSVSKSVLRSIGLPAW